ncbi:MAG: nickel pincer cofactor biosynthesis protein LarC [Verrucomicrobiota bacterium]
MATLVYNCPSGISGDMNLGAMVGLGVDPQALQAELQKLPYEGWNLHFDQDERSGISGIRTTVHVHPQHSHHHHHHHDHGHSHSQKHDHAHEEGHEHHHRTFKDIRNAIEKSSLSGKVKEDAIACFRVLAEAEGAVHGLDPEDVHFHEVGAIDSIIDMVGAAICWDWLGVDRIVCRNLEVGGGMVRCAHGLMPVPAPATARLLAGVPYRSGGTDKETTTPTGAALLVGRDCEFEALTEGEQKATSIGVGQRKDPNLPNVLYATLLEESASRNSGPAETDTVWELAANLDDQSGEAIGFLCERVREAGALDCWQVPAFFKKGRPGTVVHCLTDNAHRTAIENVFFQHSGSLGVRRQRWERTKMKREEVERETQWGTVLFKKAVGPGGSVTWKAGYDDCSRIAKETGRSIDAVRLSIEKLIETDGN